MRLTTLARQANPYICRATSRQHCVRSMAYKEDSSTAKPLRERGHTKGSEPAWSGFLGQGSMDERLRRLILTVGELAQVTYDNLNTDGPFIGLPKWPGSSVLEKCTPRKGPGSSTADLYEVKEYMFAQVDKLHQGGKEGEDLWMWERYDVVERFDRKEDALIQEVLNKAPFWSVTATTRPVWTGFIALSKDDEGPKDVAVAFRGTIFREEWFQNVAGKELVPWLEDKTPKKAGSGPALDLVKVHKGFYTIYRDEPGDMPEIEGNKAVKLSNSPRQVIKEQLKALMRTEEVATITTTGHSLGAALATIAALDITELLEEEWDTWSKDGWRTKSKPKVSAITFASPRAGNHIFQKRMEYHIEQGRLSVLRIRNRGDAVPLTPPPSLVASAYRRQLATWGDYAAGRFALSMLKKARATLSNYNANPFDGYSHVGTELVFDSDLEEETGDPSKDVDRNIRKLKGLVGLATQHNLELYLYLVSKQLGGKEPRDVVYMNKSDNVLKPSLGIPPCWWAATSPTMQRDVDALTGKETWTPKHTVAWPGNEQEREIA